MEVSFISTVIALVVLLLGLNCLQGVAGLKVLGIFQCNYGLTSADFRVKAGATTVLVLFLALIFGPVLAALEQPRGVKHSTSSA